MSALASTRRVVVLDTRGHGRSTLGTVSLSYSRLAADAAALLQSLGISRTAVVGWSDGAIAGFQLARDRPEMVDRLYAFGINFTPSGLRPGGTRSGVFQQFVGRCRGEYAALAPQPAAWPRLEAALAAMWHSSPNYTPSQISSVRTPITIADGQYDEVITLSPLASAAALLPAGRLSILPETSHFAMLQNPTGFAADVRTTLA